MGSLLDRALIKADFNDKYPVVIRMMHDELDTAKEIYDKQMSEKAERGRAPVHKNMPPVAGGLRWSHELRERITQPLHNFKHIENAYVLAHFLWPHLLHVQGCIKGCGFL